MNRIQKVNRSKKLRIRLSKHGSAVQAPVIKSAADKTPKVQRTGNYYTQKQNHVIGVKDLKGKGNTYYNTVPAHKLRKAQKPGGLFDVGALLKTLLAKTGFRSPI
jgi:hypothetical protein